MLCILLPVCNKGKAPEVIDFQILARESHDSILFCVWYITRESIHSWTFWPKCLGFIPFASHWKCWLGAACIITYICLPFLAS